MLACRTAYLRRWYLEVYNGGLDVAELDQFAFPNVANSPSTPGEWEYWNTFTEGALLRPGQVYVIAHSLANETILARTNQTSDYLSNGDDGFQLVYGNATHYVVLDSIGDFEGDPGWGWEVCGVLKATKDHTLVRKPGVLTGNGGNWSVASGTNADDCEWIILPSDNWTDLGKFDGIFNLPTYPPTTTTVTLEKPNFTVTTTTTWAPFLHDDDGGLPPSVIGKFPDTKVTEVPTLAPDSDYTPVDAAAPMSRLFLSLLILARFLALNC